MAKILLLEDDKLFSQSLSDFLQEEGFEVICAYDPLSAYELCYQEKFDLYLFDINLPFENGLIALEQLRKANDTTPTIFITSREDQDSLYKGFLLGADDYLKKPFDLEELLLRVKAILKRHNKVEKIVLGEYLLDKEQKGLFFKGKRVELSLKAYNLLEFLITNSPRAVSFEELYELLWPNKEPSYASLRVYITKLKKYFPNAIKTIRNYGYSFDKNLI